MADPKMPSKHFTSNLANVLHSGRFALTLFVKEVIFQQSSCWEGPFTWQNRISSWSRQPPKTNSYPKAAAKRRPADARVPHRA
jgi:hypothetical protein